ncbi:ParA family protein [Bhargavaea ginsengi]|uniref:ParA family protein n=1 Tax=Bhargavaea ginsengi TaxID=426757 RepID=UPI002040C49A|nr:ParA family protein [Bhargavaea ginsengi]MCM3089151.1 ParA family protein [Bhargavaea ginsengi]
MKVITVNVNKGGTGKSTISYTLAKWLTLRKNKKVLLIDGDRSCNLSFSFPDAGASSILDIFEKTGRPVEFHHVGKNLDFIKGSEQLDDHELDLKSRQNNCMLFFMWIADNVDRLNEYDYILIDTHNDTSLVTYNFLAVADIVLGVSEPSRNGFRAWLELEDTIDHLKAEIIDVMTRKTYVTATPYLIANKVEHIGTSSKQFLEMVELQPNYLGMIQKKELLAKTLLQDKSIFEMREEMSPAEQAKHEKFYANVDAVFEKVIQAAENQ